MTAPTSRRASLEAGDREIALGNITSKATKQVANPAVSPKAKPE
jgi:hypothetical protein